MSKYPCRNSRVATRTIDGEAVIVSPDDSMLHNLNEVATIVWEMADGRHSLSDIAARLSEDYEVDAKEAMQDVQALCDELASKGVLEWCDPPLA
jgi:hypothetical protein